MESIEAAVKAVASKLAPTVGGAVGGSLLPTSSVASKLAPTGCRVASKLAAAPVRGGAALRRHRVTLVGHAYLITSATDGRRPLFADFAAGCRAAAWMGGGGKIGAANVMAWVLMPDHAHWLVQLGADLPLATVVQRLKSLTGRAIGAADGRVWQAGYHERAIRSEREWRPAARYLVRNPVRAGLVESVWDYPFWDAYWIVPGQTGDPAA